MEHNELTQMIWKTVCDVIYIPTYNEYEEQYLIEFTDGSQMKLTSVDHHDSYGMIVEWL